MASPKLNHQLIFRAVETSYSADNPWRSTYREMVREYLGGAAGKGGLSRMGGKVAREQYIPILQQAAEEHMVALAANRPRAMFTTDNSGLAPFCHRFQLAFNKHIGDIHIEEVLRNAVLNAFFVVGCVKCGHMDSGYLVHGPDNQTVAGTVPRATSIGFDWLVRDVTATLPHEMRYVGNGYRMAYADLADNEQYDQTVVRKLWATSKYTSTQYPTRIGDNDEPLSREMLDRAVDSDDMEPMCDVFDLWLPADGVVATYALNGPMMFTDPKLLCTVDWDGDRQGPYQLLTLSDAPENMLTGGPAARLRILHKLINSIARKQATRARGQKQVNVFRPGAQKDADQIRMAGDGEWRAVDDTENVKPFVVPGPDPNLQMFAKDVFGWFDRFAGNLQAAAGLGPQAGTAAQDELIHTQVSRRESFQLQRVVSFTERVSVNLANLIWNDESLFIPLEYQIPNTQYKVPVDWKPGQRKGRFEDYNIRVDPYSMPYQSPQQAMQGVMGFLQGVMLPSVQMWQQQGHIDWAQLVEMWSELNNLPQIQRVWVSDVMPNSDQPQPQGKAPAIPQPPKTYKRTPRNSNGAATQRAEQGNSLLAMAHQQYAQGQQQ